MRQMINDGKEKISPPRRESLSLLISHAGGKENGNGSLIKRILKKQKLRRPEKIRHRSLMPGFPRFRCCQQNCSPDNPYFAGTKSMSLMKSTSI